MDQSRLNFILKNNPIKNKNNVIILLNNQKTNEINYPEFNYFFINDFYLNSIKNTKFNKKFKLKLKKIKYPNKLINIINF